MIGYSYIHFNNLAALDTVHFNMIIKQKNTLCLSEASLAFSHSPGRVFPTDVPDSFSSKITPPSDIKASLYTKPNPELTPLCFLVSHNPLLYSLASKRAVARIRELEMIIGEDPGKIINSFQNWVLCMWKYFHYTTELGLVVTTVIKLCLPCHLAVPCFNSVSGDTSLAGCVQCKTTERSHMAYKISSWATNQPKPLCVFSLHTTL